MGSKTQADLGTEDVDAEKSLRQEDIVFRSILMRNLRDLGDHLRILSEPSSGEGKTVEEHRKNVPLSMRESALREAITKACGSMRRRKKNHGGRTNFKLLPYNKDTPSNFDNFLPRPRRWCGSNPNRLVLWGSDENQGLKAAAENTVRLYDQYFKDVVNVCSGTSPLGSLHFFEDDGGVRSEHIRYKTIRMSNQTVWALWKKHNWPESKYEDGTVLVFETNGGAKQTHHCQLFFSPDLPLGRIELPEIDATAFSPEDKISLQLGIADDGQQADEVGTKRVDHVDMSPFGLSPTHAETTIRSRRRCPHLSRGSSPNTQAGVEMVDASAFQVARTTTVGVDPSDCRQSCSHI